MCFCGELGTLTITGVQGTVAIYGKHVDCFVPPLEALSHKGFNYIVA